MVRPVAEGLVPNSTGNSARHEGQRAHRLDFTHCCRQAVCRLCPQGSAFSVACSSPSWFNGSWQMTHSQPSFARPLPVAPAFFALQLMTMRDACICIRGTLTAAAIPPASNTLRPEEVIFGSGAVFGLSTSLVADTEQSAAITAASSGKAAKRSETLDWNRNGCNAVATTSRSLLARDMTLTGKHRRSGTA